MQRCLRPGGRLVLRDVTSDNKLLLWFMDKIELPLANLCGHGDVKIATRSVFFDETGKRVRTKKEITGEDGQIRKGCTIIKKGEVYESHLFTVKDDRFKREPFLREVKEAVSYTHLTLPTILRV